MNTDAMLKAERRRTRLLELLNQSRKPMTGATLAHHFRTSRQIIVQDIAVLRAAGEPILSTLQGYSVWGPPVGKGREPLYRAVIASRHSKEQCEDELMLLVDLGVKILDVAVAHPLYGEIRRSLMIQSPQDVREFIEKLNRSGAELLCELTDGIHTHTLEARREDLLERAKLVLQERGYLVK